MIKFLKFLKSTFGIVVLWNVGFVVGLLAASVNSKGLAGGIWFVMFVLILFAISKAGSATDVSVKPSGGTIKNEKPNEDVNTDEPVEK